MSYEPETNITIGTVLCDKMLDRYDGLPYFAIAAYNAGHPDFALEGKRRQV